MSVERIASLLLLCLEAMSGLFIFPTGALPLSPLLSYSTPTVRKPRTELGAIAPSSD